MQRRVFAVRRALAAVALTLTVAACSGAQESAAVVYLDALVSQGAGQQSGFARYRPVNSYIGGVGYGRALMTDVSAGTEWERNRSTLTLELGGAFDRFQATLGRDDTRHLRGPAYCVFEVYGDGQRLFKSDAIRSNVTAVRVENAGGAKRANPQLLDVSVRRVQTLRLVTRYASEFTQEARFIARADGCVWAGARLTPLPDDAREKLTEGPLRDALRSAVIRVSKAIPDASADGKSLRVGIAALHLPDKTGGDESEQKLRAYIADVLFGIHRQGKVALALLPAADAKALAAALADGSAARTDIKLALTIARGFHADLLLFGAVTNSPARPKVTMRLLEVETGKTLEE